MHREGYIMQEITSYGNMSEAFDRVLRGKKRKKCRQGRYLLAHREEVIAELTAKLADGSFRLGSYHERIICENGKVRHLQIISMYDRIAVYAVMNVVDQHLHKRFIRTTGASIKKRGTHDLRKCMQLDMERDPEGIRYCYEFDIKHFYDNTRPEFVMWCYRRVFKDKILLSLLDHFLHLLPEGISFGLRSWQASGNLLLSEFLDHDWFRIIEPYIKNHQETYQNSLDAEEQHGDLRMRDGYRYHWQQSDGKAERGSVELLALGGNGEYKHDEDIAHHAQVVPVTLIVQTKHTVYCQLHEYEDIEQGDAGLEYHLALQHHIRQHRQCKGMDYIIEHAPPMLSSCKTKGSDRE